MWLRTTCVITVHRILVCNDHVRLGCLLVRWRDQSCDPGEHLFAISVFLLGNYQIITSYLSSSREYRSFTGRRQHLEIRKTGDFAASSSISCTAFHNRHAPATRPVHTRSATSRSFQNNTFTSTPSIARYKKLIGGLLRSFRIYMLSH